MRLESTTELALDRGREFVQLQVGTYGKSTLRVFRVFYALLAPGIDERFNGTRIMLNSITLKLNVHDHDRNIMHKRCTAPTKRAVLCGTQQSSSTTSLHAACRSARAALSQLEAAASPSPSSAARKSSL